MTELKVIEGSLIGKKYKPGMRFGFSLSIPCVEVESFAVLVEHDGPNNANINSMLRLANEGKAPYCVSIGVFPADLLLPDGTKNICV